MGIPFMLKHLRKTHITLNSSMKFIPYYHTHRGKGYFLSKKIAF